MKKHDYKVLIVSSSIREEGIKMLKDSASLTWISDYAAEEELVSAARDVDAMLVRSGVISPPVINASPKLKIVSRHGVGVDNVDVEECTRRGIVVTTTGDANSEAVSEYAFGCLLAASREIAIANAHVKSGKWERDEFRGIELFRKVLGIIGLGQIGTRMAKHATGFDMEALAYDPYVDVETARKLNVSLVNLEILLNQSDFISLHLPLTAETRHLIGRAEFDQMKSSAILINTARGGLIDEQALYEALANHRIAGAALDVFEQEPLPPDHPLRKLDNLLCSPHIAGQTGEALIRMSIRAAENILRVFRGETPLYVVNPEVLENTSRVDWNK